MKTLRAAVILVLLLLPVVVFAAAGAWAIWRTQTFLWLWWVLPCAWSVAFFLARWWDTELVPLPAQDLKSPPHWTPQDEAALRLVEARQHAVKAIAAEELAKPRFYLDTALELSDQIARHYHPQSRDPVGSLTVPEILAAAHLAFEDLEQWARDYIPASHLLTVDHWRTLSKAPGWLKTASNVSWAVWVLLYPANLLRYVMSKVTTDTASRRMQAGALAWFYVMFVRRVGFYLIEMNSGRLRGGADRYRRAMAELNRAARPAATDHVDHGARAALEPPDLDPLAATEPSEVTIAVVGQVNAGKSSLINALLGEQQAATDVLPLTRHVQRFRLGMAEAEDRLTLLDTAGYGAAGTAPADLEEMREAFQRADLVLLVMDASNPAHDPDVRLLREMAQWYASQPRLRPPPVIGVLSHIDLLRPVREWSPPYDWNQPESAKERTIHEAVAYQRQQFGQLLATVVPACTDGLNGRVYGIEEWLLPAITTLLGEARACSLIRALHAEFDAQRVRRVLSQLLKAGRAMLAACLEE